MAPGKGGTFKCEICGRGTRHTGVQSLGSDLCPQCFELAGIENGVSDYGDEALADYGDRVPALVAELTAKGADVSAWEDLLAKVTAFQGAK